MSFTFRRLPRRSYAPRPASLSYPHGALQLAKSFSSTRPVASSGARISTVFGALLCLGIGTTAYGVYEFYSSFATWPQELRADLRAGLKAKHHGDLVLSEKYLRRAWETAQTLSVETLAPQPYLKLSGIGIALAGVLEETDLPQQAYDVYNEVLKRLRAQKEVGRLSASERMRSVQVAYKLGEMAEAYQQPPEEEEKWLSFAVEEVLRIVKESQVVDGKGKVPTAGKDDGLDESKVLLADLDLPAWVSKTDVVAPIEALGAFYARTGKIEYAVPLYLQAISMYLPPASSQKAPGPEDGCRGAQLMNNLSELFVRGSPTPDKLHQAEAWARQALDIVQRFKEAAQPLSVCDFALAAILINLGTLREMANDRSSARDFFTAGLEQSKSIKMKEGIVEAQTALRRLDRLDRNSNKNPPSG